ncbi:hypothetical protein SAMN05892883_1469 [Jatrophihabitans sp. GAS493]|uniref:hypothetical protein n=1 Tax=Jatrophihabitans sp. GAS493 TaxID=1907575 RepID=UPI000BBF4DCC|nr:hypothetical protein [Jatrophihabitans sp. GAS493]SOD72022.1 hypothetical protein SAMN05892883_1469 [Jatrophihabitans sp. GAS493]
MTQNPTVNPGLTPAGSPAERPAGGDGGQRGDALRLADSLETHPLLSVVERDRIDHIRLLLLAGRQPVAAAGGLRELDGIRSALQRRERQQQRAGTGTARSLLRLTWALALATLAISGLAVFAAAGLSAGRILLMTPLLITLMVVCLSMLKSVTRAFGETDRRRED